MVAPPQPTLSSRTIGPRFPSQQVNVTGTRKGALMTSVRLYYNVLGLCLVSALAMVGGSAQAAPDHVAAAAEQAAGITRITPAQFERFLHEGNVVLVDVRSYGAYLNAHLPSATSIPLDKLEGALAKLRRSNARIVLYCGGDAGVKSGRAATLLLDHGFQEVYCLDGGFERWVASGRVVFVEPTET
jgi:rhodanese-related sulfurtransferase